VLRQPNASVRFFAIQSRENALHRIPVVAQVSFRYSDITPAHKGAQEPATAAGQPNMAATERFLDITDFSRYFPYDGN
jgi:hypothetical protein